VKEAHKFLRETTSPYHARVDEAFGSFDLKTPDGYRHFLQAQAMAFLPVEAALDEGGAGSLLYDWQNRKRGAALLSDLRDLDAVIPEALRSLALADDAELWGALYVIEGSRLGGRFLAGSIPPHLPKAFMTHSVEKCAWRSLLDRLDLGLVNDDDRKKAASAAQAVFRLFEDAAVAVRKAWYA
jgi:heme oxygenase